MRLQLIVGTSFGGVGVGVGVGVVVGWISLEAGFPRIPPRTGRRFADQIRLEESGSV